MATIWKILGRYFWHKLKYIKGFFPFNIEQFHFSIKLPPQILNLYFSSHSLQIYDSQFSTDVFFFSFLFFFFFLPYEQTQPVPNPLSYYLHQNPEFIHKAETLANHVVELIVPFFIFLPRPFRLICGILQVFFQVTKYHAMIIIVCRYYL